MADEATASPGIDPPKIPDVLKASWTTFRQHAQILVTAFGIFLGASVVLAVLLQLISGQLGWFLRIFLSVSSFVPMLLLMPGLYAISLRCVRNQKAEVRDLFIMFNDRFVHHLGMLLLQSCGAFVCMIGMVVTQALFIPGSFLVIDRHKDWDDAVSTCLENIKPKLVPWILFSLTLSVVAVVGFCAFVVGSLVTVPVAICAWAHAYDQCFAKR